MESHHTSVFFLRSAIATISNLLCRYFIFGWAFAYGDKVDDSGNSIGNPFIGTDQFGMAATDGTKYNTFLFQYVVRPNCPEYTWNLDLSHAAAFWLVWVKFMLKSASSVWEGLDCRMTGLGSEELGPCCAVCHLNSHHRVWSSG